MTSWRRRTWIESHVKSCVSERKGYGEWGACRDSASCAKTNQAREGVWSCWSETPKSRWRVQRVEGECWHVEEWSSHLGRLVVRAARGVHGSITPTLKECVWRQGVTKCTWGASYQEYEQVGAIKNQFRALLQRSKTRPGLWYQLLCPKSIHTIHAHA